MTPRSPAQPPGAVHAPARKPKRTRDPDAKRAAILEAARASFAERGYAGATLRDIAKRASVTHGLVIRHFESKESLFLAASQTTEIIAEDSPVTWTACRTGSRARGSSRWKTPAAMTRCSH